MLMVSPPISPSRNPPAWRNNPGDQDVGRLDIAVQDLGLMRGGQSIGDAYQQLDDLAPGALLRLRPIFECATVNVFRDQVLLPWNSPAS
jgi:hypothetical protein